MRERPIFTFHYVSIKTYDRCRPAHQNSYLHSTMYLLKPAVRITQSQSLTFTFHYVSIKTYLNYSLYNHHYYLHSTMYLLKRGQHRRHIQSHMYLHSTMYLLKQDNISDCYLVSSFTFHYVSIKTKRRCNRCTNRL